MAKLSKSRLTRLNEYLSDYVPDKLPGCSLLINQSGEEVFYTQLGYADLETKKELQRDTIFRIFSMTKAPVCIGAMILFEKGLIHLDDPVEKFIPEWKNLRVYVSGTRDNMITSEPERAMLVRDLMTHTSGLTYGFSDTTPVNELYDEKLWSNSANSAMNSQNAVDTLATIPLLYSPGSFWNYSVAIDVLGIIIERVTEQSLATFLESSLFAPLGMLDTGFKVEAKDQNRFASCYMFREDETGFDLADAAEGSKYLSEPTFYSGGGGAVSTIDDYMKFLSLISGNGASGSVRILGPRTVDLFLSNQFEDGVDIEVYQKTDTGFPFSSGIGHCLGGAVNIDPLKALSPVSARGEYFWFGAAFTLFWYDPEEDVSVVFMSQMLNYFRNYDGINIMRDIRTIIGTSLT